MQKMKGRNGGTLMPPEKGETNNPNGRPKGRRTWAKVLEDMMPESGYMNFDNAEVLGEDGKPTGERIKVRVQMATQERVVLAALRQAMKGDVRATNLIMERMDGKPVQPVDLTTIETKKTTIELPDGGVIEI